MQKRNESIVMLDLDLCGGTMSERRFMHYYGVIKDYCLFSPSGLEGEHCTETLTPFQPHTMYSKAFGPSIYLQNENDVLYQRNSSPTYMHVSTHTHP